MTTTNRTYPFHGFAPGSYLNKCVEKDCRTSVPLSKGQPGYFYGHKRALRCEGCAEKIEADSAVIRNRQLETDRLTFEAVPHSSIVVR